MKVRLLMLGKTRRPEMGALLDDYMARIRHACEGEAVELRDSAAAGRKMALGTSAAVVLLDAGGKRFTSEEFAKWLGERRERGTRELVFLCGDAEGFPPELRRRAEMKFSLTPLTLSHELAPSLLAHQPYPAFALLSGSPYPK